MKKLFSFLLAVIFSVGCFSVTALSSYFNMTQIEQIEFQKGEQNAVSFSWSEAEGANFYYIYKLNVKSNRYERIAATKSTELTVDNLESGKSYYFRVLPVAVKDARKKPGKISDIVVCVTAPAGDLVVETKDITESSVTLSWNRIAGATGYKVYYFDEAKGRYIAYRYTDKTSMTVSGFKKNTEYKFKVRAFRWVGDALAYGVTSDEYSEYTHTDGTPKTKAQVARAYNTLVNSLKAKTSVTVKHTRTVGTEFISCSKQNLALTVENTSNLFDGSLTKTYSFASGKSGSVSLNGLVEPAGKKATLSNGDIYSFRVKEVENGYSVSMVLRSDKGNKPGASYSDGVLSATDIKKLDTTPLTVKSVDSYYDKTTVAFAVRDGEIKILKLNTTVIADISFEVAGVSADTVISYDLFERYGIS